MTGRSRSFTALALPPREAGHACLPLALCGSACRDSGWPFAAGSRLPAHAEDLAGEYGLSRGTVVSAFEELKSEGYLHGSAGSGTLCKQRLAGTLAPGGSGSQPEISQPGNHAHDNFSEYGVRVQSFSNLESRPTRAFRANLPALDLFPTKIWTRLAERRLRHLSIAATAGLRHHGLSSVGERPLPTIWNRSRGTHVAGAVMIVSGTQEALDLAGGLILNPGDQVWCRGARISRAAMALRLWGRDLSRAVDSEGMELPGPSARKAKLVVRDSWASISWVHDTDVWLGGCQIAGMGSPFHGAFISEDDYE